LKMLMQSKESYQQGRYKSAEKAFSNIRQQLKSKGY
jgi:hypothetical protein